LVFLPAALAGSRWFCLGFCRCFPTQTAFEQLGQVDNIRRFALLFATHSLDILDLAFVGFFSTRAMILASNSSL
jgi:hypothetical protein